jgi:chaperonin cofactor prefoldin
MEKTAQEFWEVLANMNKRIESLEAEVEKLKSAEDLVKNLKAFKQTIKA